jgi:hypothetical protein
MSEKIEFTPENKFRWLSRMYFSVSDSPKHDVNPFEEMAPFLAATVGEMDWGKDAGSRKQAKAKFTELLLIIFKLYDFVIPEAEIIKCLENEKMTNSDMIKHLAATGTFPKS